MAWLLVELTEFLLLVFAALVLAAVFSSLARGSAALTDEARAMRWRSRYSCLLAVFSSVFALFGSQMASEFDTIQQSIPPAIDRVRGTA